MLLDGEGLMFPSGTTLDPLIISLDHGKNSFEFRLTSNHNKYCVKELFCMMENKTN